ncbi:MAG: L-histidine N(alpha)-methyltransferase [Planctomycetota bacterium]
MNDPTTAQTTQTGAAAEFRADVIEGLARPSKSIPPKYLYDDLGSALFDEICETEDYYLTRTEAALFEDHLEEIAEAIGSRVLVVEPGPGNGEKAARLLRELDRPVGYVPYDVSTTYVEGATERVAEVAPEVDVYPSVGDFNSGVEMPEDVDPAGGVLVFFPGSTYGNLERDQRDKLLKRFRSMISADGRVLIGVDLVKDTERLLLAYDDRQGVTERFALNLLRRFNDELDAEIDPDSLEYAARWDAEHERIEMGLVSKSDQQISIADRTFDLRAGEWIRTEYSKKFTEDGLAEELAAAGLRIEHTWKDERTPYLLALIGPIDG